MNACPEWIHRSWIIDTDMNQIIIKDRTQILRCMLGVFICFQLKDVVHNSLLFDRTVPRIFEQPKICLCRKKSKNNGTFLLTTVILEH